MATGCIALTIIKPWRVTNWITIERARAASAAARAFARRLTQLERQPSVPAYPRAPTPRPPLPRPLPAEHHHGSRRRSRPPRRDRAERSRHAAAAGEIGAHADRPAPRTCRCPAPAAAHYASPPAPSGHGRSVAQTHRDDHGRHRRWARQMGMANPSFGHKHGTEHVEDVRRTVELPTGGRPQNP